VICGAVLIVLDSLGVGALPDAELFGDEGSNTLGNIARAVGGLNLPHLGSLGLGHLLEIPGVPPEPSPRGAYGRMAEKSAGKDTTTGHWEMAGIITTKPLPTYPAGFPQDLINELERLIGRKTLGNKMASGTEIIKELGAEHLRTGKPIVYTSADSVFQIAAHEEVIPVEELYQICRTARQLLQGPHGVGRVIARPFLGQPGNFQRTPNRKDFSLEPPESTLLDRLRDKEFPVIGIGKIADIFAGRGVSAQIHTEDNQDGVNKTLAAMKEVNQGLIFTNLVDFDSKYGHRNDPAGYARALKEFDDRLPELLAALNREWVLVITADHGCDPTTPSTDHSREYVPLLLTGEAIPAGLNLGTRESFADLGATIAGWLDLRPLQHGRPIKELLTTKTSN